jgi:hypothetical protein
MWAAVAGSENAANAQAAVSAAAACLNFDIEYSSNF